MALSDADAAIRNDIMMASDKVNIKVVEEFITEPLGASQNLKRTVVEDWYSATVQIGKKYRMTHVYMNGTESKAWAACSDHVEEII
jgi:hypothetical protein